MNSQALIPALCFGGAFGLPLIIWGLILIVDRDRSWQRKLRTSRATQPPRRSRAWDRRQILYGSLLMALGLALMALLSALNYLAQGISPPPPF